MLALLAIALLVPPSLVAVDLTGRAMRERLPLRDELLRVARLAMPLAGAALGALVAGLTDVAPSSPSAYPFPGEGSGVGVGGALLVIAGLAIGAAAIGLLPPAAEAAPVDPAVRAAVAITAALVCGCAGATLATRRCRRPDPARAGAPRVGPAGAVTRGGAAVRDARDPVAARDPGVLIARAAGLDTGEAVRL